MKQEKTLENDENIDNPETLTTQGTQDTGWKQTKLHTKNTTQKTKIYYFT